MHEPRRAVRARRRGARRGGARPDPDPGAVPRLRGRLREVNEVARRLDGDVTVISLEPVSVEGILNSIQAVGRDDRGRGRGRRRRRGPARAAAGRRGDRRSGGATTGSSRRASPRSSGSTRRSRRPLGPRAGAPRRRLGAARRRRAAGASRRHGPRSREVDPEILVLMPCGFGLPTRSPSGRGAEARRAGPSCARSATAACSRSTAPGCSRGPGPRVVDGIEVLAELIDPAAFDGMSPPDTGPASAEPATPRTLARSAPPSTACGAARRGRPAAPDDLEGWAQLCSTCLGKAGANPFLRVRLRRRSRSEAGRRPRLGATAVARRRAPRPAPRRHRRHPPRTRPSAAARAPRPAQPRRSRTTGSCAAATFARGALHDTAWDAELDVVTRWLDGQPLAGRIEEPAAGIGLLLAADRGQGRAARDRPRRRGARSRARPAARPPPARAPPRRGPVGRRPRDGPGADGVLAAFLLGRVRGAGLDTRHAVAARPAPARRPPGARSSCCPDPAGGPPAGHPVDLARPGRRRGVAPRGRASGPRAHDDRALLPARRAEAG